MHGLHARRLALFAAALVALAGCGSGHQSGDDLTVAVSVSEYRITPPSAHVSAGLVTVLVRNEGRLTHNLVISRDGHVDGSTKPLWPGSSAELTLPLTRGDYLMASTILSDQALGAYGMLHVGS
jgi:Cupredoxin-like domain